jgi:Ca2+-transporting ATPase
MIIDPVCSLAFEAEEDERNVMARPPRRPDTSLFSRWLVGWSVIQGSLAFGVTGGLTLYFWESGMGEEQLRSTAFLTLVLGITSLILINRRFSSSIMAALRRFNPALSVVLGLVAAILLATQFIPPIADLFNFARVAPEEIGIIALASIVMLFVLERLKPLWGSRLLE